MAACGSESSRSDNVPQTAGFDPSRTSSASQIQPVRTPIRVCRHPVWYSCDMTKSLDELLAMSNRELEQYAATLQPKSLICWNPWILDDLDDLKERFVELINSDLGDGNVVRYMAQVRRCIEYREAVERDEDRDEAWAKAFDRPLEEIKRVQKRSAQIVAKLNSQ